MPPATREGNRTSLRVTAGPAAGQLIVIEEQLQLGSSEQGAGSLGGDTALSSEHALVSCAHGGMWIVRDLGSDTGTFLNGRPLSAIEPVFRGDTLRLGESRLLVIAGPPRAPQDSTAVFSRSS